MSAPDNDAPATPGVAIVGSGFSGAALAWHLLRAHGPATPRVVLCGRAGEPGRGIAYGTGDPAHLLNVPAARMSLDPARPDHFLRWLRRRRDPGAGPASFAPRAWYGEYVGACLSEAAEAAPPEAFALVRDVIPTARHDAAGWRLEPKGRAPLRCRALVLATGHGPPRPLPGRHGPERVVDDPWRRGLPPALAPDARVVIVGAGLTMVDLLLSVRAAGCRAPVLAISRRGRRPLAHAGDPLAPATPLAGWPPPPGTPLGALVAGARQAARELAARGESWHGAVDALRDATPQLWRGLAETDRARFVRLVRPLWDLHRHRLAPAAAQRLDEEFRAGGVSLLAGDVRSVDDEAGGVVLTCREARDRTILRLRADLVLNATGPDPDPARSGDPLTRALLASGEIVRDPHGLGLSADAGGHALGIDGRPRPGLYVLGPALRARDWEATAVPELARHAAALARELAGTRDRTAGSAAVSG